MMKNGSERTPEHPTGTDYETLVRALRVAGPVDDFGLRQVAADAVEALLAENEKLRADLAGYGTHGAIAYEQVERRAQYELRLAALRERNEVRAERDALQAQLDAVRKYVMRVPFPKADKVLAILDPAEHHTKVEDQ
jgi:hypothetical protein